MTTYRQRFGLTHAPLPRDACGKTCFLEGDAYLRLCRVFEWLAADPGLGLLTGEAGCGKTTLMRHLCAQLPEPDHKVIYLCDTRVTAMAVYRGLAAALGLRPAHRRDELWRQLKATLAALYERESIAPILVLDEAHHLGDDFLLDLAGFLNHKFDRRDLMTIWLVGLPTLRLRLELQVHAALRSRIISPNILGPRPPDELAAMIRHGLRVAGARDRLLDGPALEVLYRVSRGVPRLAAKLLRAALVLADERGRESVDDGIVLDAADELDLARPRRDGDTTGTTPRRA